VTGNLVWRRGTVYEEGLNEGVF